MLMVLMVLMVLMQIRHLPENVRQLYTNGFLFRRQARMFHAFGDIGIKHDHKETCVI